MIRLCIQAFVLLLAACNTPGPGFRDAPETLHMVDGSRFIVRHKDGVAEVTRTSPELLPRFDAVAARASVAVTQATGCRAGWVEGDVALMWVGLSCNGAPAPPRPRKPRAFWCDMVVDDGFICEEL